VGEEEKGQKREREMRRKEVCQWGPRLEFGGQADLNTALNSGVHSRAEWVRLLRSTSSSRLGGDMVESWRLYCDEGERRKEGMEMLLGSGGDGVDDGKKEVGAGGNRGRLMELEVGRTRMARKTRGTKRVRFSAREEWSVVVVEASGGCGGDGVGKIACGEDGGAGCDGEIGQTIEDSDDVLERSSSSRLKRKRTSPLEFISLDLDE